MQQLHSSLGRQGWLWTAETKTYRVGSSLLGREAAVVQLNLVLEGKDVGQVGAEAAEQGSALRETNPLLAGVGWELGSKKNAWFLRSLADGMGPVAGRESWHLLDPFVAMPGFHLQNGECLSLRSLLKGVPLRPKAKVLQPHDLSTGG